MSEDIVQTLRNVHQRRIDRSGSNEVIIENLRETIEEQRRAKRHKVAIVVGFGVGLALAAATGHPEAAILAPCVTTAASILKR